MRIISAALLVILAGAGYWIPQIETGLTLPPDFDQWRNLAVVLLGVWLLIEGILATKRAKAAEEAALALEGFRKETADIRGAMEERETRLASLERDLAAAKNELAATRNEANTNKAQLVAAETRRNELAEALEDAQGRLIRMKEEMQKQKHRVGDQEVLQFLGLLQRKGRFIDFIMDDVTKYPDAQIGAAARVVHQGCTSVVREYFDIKPVLEQQEGAPLTLDKDFDAKRYKLLGKVRGEPPYRGRLLHRGWLTTSVKLPEPIEGQLSPEAKGIITPAEVEVS